MNLSKRDQILETFRSIPNHSIIAIYSDPRLCWQSQYFVTARGLDWNVPTWIHGRFYRRDNSEETMTCFLGADDCRAPIPLTRQFMRRNRLRDPIYKTAVFAHLLDVEITS